MPLREFDPACRNRLGLVGVGLLEGEQEGQASIVELFTKGSEPTQATQRRLDPIDFYKLDQIPEGAL